MSFDISGAPMMGTPKQNAFLCKMLAALEYASPNAACVRHLGKPLTGPLSLEDASKLIEALLEECKGKGVFVGGGKKGGGRRKRREEGGKRLSEGEAKEAKNAKAETAEDRAAVLKGYTANQLDEELKRRGVVAANMSTEALVAELERRGIPAELAQAKPDMVAAAQAFVDLIQDCLRKGSGMDWTDRARKALENAGIECLA